MNIAIIFYNKPEQTVEALKSVGDTHVIYLLNNGSHPEATEIVEKYIKESKQDIHYTKLSTNTGASVGRNALIRQIQEGWIVFMDNDVTIETQDWQNILSKYIGKYPDALAFAPRLCNVHENNLLLPWYNLVPEQGIIKVKIANEPYNNIIRGGATIINRKLFDIVGMYDENFIACLEDNELSLRAIHVNKPFKVYHIPEIVFNHTHRKSTHAYDNTYLDVRYGEDTLTASQARIKELYGLEHDHDPKKWCEKQVNIMKADVAPTEPERKVRRVLLYAINQYRIGGIETFNINFCKRMSKYYDVTFLCEKGDIGRLREMSQFCKVVINKGQMLETDVCIYTVAWGKRPHDTVRASEYIQMIHADYEWLGKTLGFKYEKLPKVTKHIAVGENVAEKFKKMTGFDATVIPNVLDPDAKPKRVLRLVTIARISKEKGFERMKILADKLSGANIPFLWLIYGDSNNDQNYNVKVRGYFAGMQQVVFMGVNEHPMDYVADCDYLVGLSDSEGFSYSTYEALQAGTACLITNYPSGKEQVTDGVNGYVVDMDLKNLDVEKLYNHIPKGFKFEEKTKDADWIKVLGTPAPKGTVTINGMDEIEVEVKVAKSYTDLELKRKLEIGDIIKVDPDRANYLVQRGLVKLL